MIILGIESSCDETAAALYDSTHGILSSELFSQTEFHKKYGGVVPEIASRAQLEKIGLITDQALLKASITLNDVDAIAVTHTPGLPGSLLVGLCFAKALAYSKNKKIIGINHLEGHAFSAMIEHEIPFPYLCLTASGGHTSLYLIKDYGDYEILGQTTDDAAGEAFDKVAKMLNHPYPGGPVIEQLAESVDFYDFFNYPRLKNPTLMMSFSGLKTAVMYDLVKRNAYDLATKKCTTNDPALKAQVASSLLVCMGDIFKDRIQRALKAYPFVRALAFVGGVACNKYLGAQLKTVATSHNIPFYVPSPKYCTDNAAMIAFVGAYKAEQGKFCDLTLDLHY